MQNQGRAYEQTCGRGIGLSVFGLCSFEHYRLKPYPTLYLYQYIVQKKFNLRLFNHPPSSLVHGDRGHLKRLPINLMYENVLKVIPIFKTKLTWLSSVVHRT